MTNVDHQPDKLDSGHVEEEFLPSPPPRKLFVKVELQWSSGGLQFTVNKRAEQWSHVLIGQKTT